MGRPKWLPKKWRWWGPVSGQPFNCEFCGGPARMAATTWERGIPFCDDCSDRAKAAICGGDDGDG